MQAASSRKRPQAPPAGPAPAGSSTADSAVRASRRDGQDLRSILTDAGGKRKGDATKTTTFSPSAEATQVYPEEEPQAKRKASAPSKGIVAALLSPMNAIANHFKSGKLDSLEIMRLSIVRASKVKKPSEPPSRRKCGSPFRSTTPLPRDCHVTLPAPVEHPKTSTATRAALKKHIMRQREKSEQEREADAATEPVRGEREPKRRQDATTLEEIRDQVQQSEKKLAMLKEEKHKLCGIHPT
ncbi:uncharacterized protein LOC142590867 [Dermacentor variabilis]|uniref:uncharacterized protein LOC142590867 n=1 Tax=Dermacentor variabilis TaxID=34621 RepID=UPI003F5C556A